MQLSRKDTTPQNTPHHTAPHHTTPHSTPRHTGSQVPTRSARRWIHSAAEVKPRDQGRVGACEESGIQDTSRCVDPTRYTGTLQEPLHRTSSSSIARRMSWRQDQSSHAQWVMFTMGQALNESFSVKIRDKREKQVKLIAKCRAAEIFAL